jgi:hypothetical protein
MKLGTIHNQRQKEQAMHRIFIALPIVAAALVPLPASAGCVGAGIGDGCIGIPTPSYHEQRPVVIEREHRSVSEQPTYNHRAPVVIERDDED